jgi:hypothetical protein
MKRAFSPRPDSNTAVRLHAPWKWISVSAGILFMAALLISSHGVARPAEAGECYGIEPCGPCGGGICYPDCPYYDPCKLVCPGVGFCPFDDCRPECGGDCDQESAYCDNPPPPCPGGHCLPDYPANGPSCTGTKCRFGHEAGQGTFETDSIKFRFGLGLLPGNSAAPTLWVHRIAPDATLSTPASLHIAPKKRVDRYPGFEGYANIPGLERPEGWEPGTPVRQVRAPQAFADVVTNGPYEYSIKFYDTEDIDDWPRDGDYYAPQNLDPPKIPFVTWVIQNPDGETSCNNLRITKKSGDGTTLAQYDYAFDEEAGSWTLTASDSAGVAQYQESRTRVDNPGAMATVETLVVREGGSALDSVGYRSERTYSWFNDWTNSGQLLGWEFAGPISPEPPTPEPGPNNIPFPQPEPQAPSQCDECEPTVDCEDLMQQVLDATGFGDERLRRELWQLYQEECLDGDDPDGGHPMPMPIPFPSPILPPLRRVG